MLISAIIPTLNEEQQIAACLAAVAALPGDWETIVADGGSSDGTVSAARAAGATRVIAGERGRGPQLNAGARLARGGAVLFLHADVRLPRDAARHVAETLADPRWSGGAFRLRHRPGAGCGPLARRLLWLAALRSRYTRLPYGDQAVFTSRALFERAGGFPAQALMEDLELARRLRRIAPLRRVPAPVSAAARRFEQRPLHSFLCWNLFPLLYAAGVSPERLARWYGYPRDKSS